MTAAWLLPIVPCVVAAASGGLVSSVLSSDLAFFTIAISYMLWCLLGHPGTFSLHGVEPVYRADEQFTTDAHIPYDVCTCRNIIGGHSKVHLREAELLLWHATLHSKEAPVTSKWAVTLLEHVFAHELQSHHAIV